jgi:hypothetical protein
METQTALKVRYQFVGTHRWPDAPEDVGFLRYDHRHTFHVTVSLLVQHLNRQVEFFQFQKRIAQALAEAFLLKGDAYNLNACSCEMVALELLEALQPEASSVIVEEDGENGAEVSRA